jgi:hypothetical protein
LKLTTTSYVTALGPDVIKDESDDEKAKNSNDAVADVIEIGAGLNFDSFF